MNFPAEVPGGGKRWTKPLPREFKKHKQKVYCRRKGSAKKESQAEELTKKGGERQILCPKGSNKGGTLVEKRS